MLPVQTMTRSQLVEKWKPVLDVKDEVSIKDSYKRYVTAALLENQEHDCMNTAGPTSLFEAAPANAAGSMPDTGGVAKFDPVLVSLVRRSMPLMIAYDVCGVQPMTQPTGLIFAMKTRYTSQGGTEALFNEANTQFSGDTTGTAQVGSNPVSGTYTTGSGMSTSEAEDLGDPNGGNTFNQMAFTIEKTTVTATTRALKAEYTNELAQDLRAVHGLDAEAELSNILTHEILAEINREIIRKIYVAAYQGADYGTTTPGVFDLDVDANGRWSVEKFKGLMFQLEREANRIAQLTRRGKGNFIICSSDVASALAMAGMLDFTPALQENQLMVDEASTTFAGILNRRFKVFVDPYSANGSANQFAVVGYKGPSPFDAGIFYCPYVPLQLFRAVDPNTMQPKLGFRTRYGIVANPFTTLDGGGGSAGLTANTNYYFRRIKILNIL